LTDTAATVIVYVMNNAVLNARLAVLSSYYAELDELLATEERILDTYEGMFAQFNNGEGADHLFTGRDNTVARIGELRADRAEIDRMWNEALLAAEEAA
jgi:hypothetical protein